MVLSNTSQKDARLLSPTLNLKRPKEFSEQLLGNAPYRPEKSLDQAGRIPKFILESDPEGPWKGRGRAWGFITGTEAQNPGNFAQSMTQCIDISATNARTK